jgi:hypothetical protein
MDIICNGLALIENKICARTGLLRHGRYPDRRRQDHQSRGTQHEKNFQKDPARGILTARLSRIFSRITAGNFRPKTVSARVRASGFPHAVSARYHDKIVTMTLAHGARSSRFHGRSDRPAPH